MRGEYVTKQKQEILRFLSEKKMRGMSAEEIARELRAQGVRVGNTTVYRFVEALCEQGSARKYLNPEGVARYQYLGEHAQCDKHFHMMCRRCGDLFHIDCDKMNELLSHLMEAHGFSIDPRESVLVGLCENCRKEERGNGSDPA